MALYSPMFKTKTEECVIKRPHLWLIVLVTWLLSILTLQHPLIAVLSGPLSILQRSSLIIFLGWINFAWLYAIYQFVVMIFAAATSRRGQIPSSHSACQGLPVAILYTTMNDFSDKAAMSCISQEYPRFHVFLLDDSTEPQYRLQVEAFHTRFQKITTVLRREDREGFKAGNLNHALKLISSSYEFFAVCDADGILPPDFISKTMAHFVNDNIGFVQARHRAIISDEATSFATDLAISVEIYWDRIIPSAQTFGFVLFHGHGGIIKTKVWREIGEFPTVVAEDLAFSTRAREKGYIGVIANGVVCEEEFPSSYHAFSKRQLKYTRGAFEHLRKGTWSFLSSSRITWIEKIDRLLSSLAMVSAFPLLIFLLDFALVLPVAFSASLTLSLSKIEGPGSMWGILKVNTNLLPVLTWPFLIMTIVTLLTPLAPAACHLWRNPAKLIRYVVASVAVHLSLVFDQVWDICVVAATGKNFFSATGDLTGYRRTEASARAAGLCRLNIIDVLGTLFLFSVAVVSASVGLLPICLATGVGLAAKKFGWEHMLVKAAVLLPVTVVFLLIVFACDAAVGLSGLSVLAAPSGF